MKNNGEKGEGSIRKPESATTTPQTNVTGSKAPTAPTHTELSSQRLLTACREGNLHVVQACISNKRADVNYKEPRTGITPLIAAITSRLSDEYTRADIAKALVIAGALATDLNLTIPESIANAIDAGLAKRASYLAATAGRSQP